MSVQRGSATARIDATALKLNGMRSPMVGRPLHDVDQGRGRAARLVGSGARSALRWWSQARVVPEFPFTASSQRSRADKTSGQPPTTDPPWRSGQLSAVCQQETRAPQQIVYGGCEDVAGTRRAPNCLAGRVKVGLLQPVPRARAISPARAAASRGKKCQ